MPFLCLVRYANLHSSCRMQQGSVSSLATTARRCAAHMSIVKPQGSSGLIRNRLVQFDMCCVLVLVAMN